jgi:hypothetical protein
MDKEKIYTQALDSSSGQIYGIDDASTQPPTALNKPWSVSVSDSDAAKILCVTASGEKKKFIGVVLRKYGVRVK